MNSYSASSVVCTLDWGQISNTSSLEYNIEKDKLKSNLHKLTEFSSYKDNWDGYTGKRISQEVIKTAKAIVRRLNIQPQIYPISAGGVQIEYYKDDSNNIEIELLDGLQYNILLTKAGKEIEYSVDTKEECIEILNDFYEDINR
jgi:hypothetical protein